MIHVATVGTSAITRQFIDALSRSNKARLCAVYSRAEARAAEFAAQTGAQKTYTSLQLMSEDDGIDAVYIASPNSLHASQAQLFLNAKKHVLCEKPICVNAKDAERTLNCAKENGVLFADALMTLYSPAYKAFKALLPLAGTVRSVYFDFARYSSRYDAHKRGADVNTFKAAFANGAAADMGVYALYPCIDLFGAPKRVLAAGTVVPGGVDGEGTALLSYEGFTACLHFSKIADSFAQSRIEGETATILLDSIHTPTHAQVRFRDGRTQNYDFKTPKNPMQPELEEFADCVGAGRTQTPSVPHALSLLCVKTLEAIRAQIL